MLCGLRGIVLFGNSKNHKLTYLSSQIQNITQQKYLQKQGWTMLSSAVVRYQLRFRLDVSNLAFSCYLQFQFSNQHLFGAGQAMNPLPSQILNVKCKFFFATVHIFDIDFQLNFCCGWTAVP